MKTKEILAAIGALAVVILQIVNVLQGVDIESILGKKSNLMEQKAADLSQLVKLQTQTLGQQLHDVIRPAPTPAPTQTPNSQ